MNPPKLTAQTARKLKKLLPSLSDEQKRDVRKRLAEFEASAQVQADHSIYYIPSTRMRQDLGDNKVRFPVEGDFKSNGRTAMATVSHDDFESFTEWLERYGCTWQEE
jgi:hypothetical protein